ncbi:MAG: hypothetical protein VX988_07735 [Planctomycetota bacterium]|nr:hypothetical protein [Planctomycetota bacterium]
MTDFANRLSKAIERGVRTKDEQQRGKAEESFSEDDFKRLHNQYRLELSEHLEQCLSCLPDHFPGFRYETLVNDRGWGAACSRDDVGAGAAGKRDNFYSRIEMVVRPFATYHVLELTAKGTIRNREIYNRKHFKKLYEVDTDSFVEMIDQWVLEYAELYAAQS